MGGVWQEDQLHVGSMLRVVQGLGLIQVYLGGEGLQTLLLGREEGGRKVGRKGGRERGREEGRKGEREGGKEGRE